VAKSEEIFEDCKKWPTISCFAERDHSWTRLPPFDINVANEACQMLHGLKNLASFYKLPRKLQPIVSDREKLTDRTIELARVTKGE
jgi:hypothetical protein